MKMLDNKKTLIMVGGGILQVPAVKIAKELGYRTIVTDQNINAYAMQYADIPIVISSKDIEGHIKFVKEAQKKYNIVGIYTQGTDVEVTVAKTAAALGLPGIDPEAARCCNNKFLMRQKMLEQGFDRPRFKSALTLAEARKAGKEVGYPFIMKPIDNCASRGLTKIEKENELEEAFNDAQANSSGGMVLLEEYLEGKEYSVDTIIYKGKLYPAGISDREFDYSSKFAVQTGSITPSRLPEETQDKIYELMAKTSRIIGVDNGAFKGDIIIVNGEPLVLEVTARLSGGFDSQYRKPYSFGINLIKATIDIAVGKKLDFTDIIPKWVKVSKTTSPFPKPGKIVSIQGVEEAIRIAGIRNIFMVVKEGDVIPVYHHCAQRVGFLIAAGDTYEEVDKSLKKALETIKINTV